MELTDPAVASNVVDQEGHQGSIYEPPYTAAKPIGVEYMDLNRYYEGEDNSEQRQPSGPEQIESLRQHVVQELIRDEKSGGKGRSGKRNLDQMPAHNSASRQSRRK